MTDNSKIWLSSPHMGGNEQQFINEAFQENWIAPLGSNVNGFEQDLEQYLGDKSQVSVLNSGTAAIHIALVLLGVTNGDEVICQSLTFCASINPIIYLGAVPILIDSEPDTWNLCPITLEKAIIDRLKQGKKPKAIITISLYGTPYKIDDVRTIADKYEIPIIEDSAEALGSKYKGKACGTFGDIGILSFNGNKIITTSCGGALVTKSAAIKAKTIFLATQAKDNAVHYQHTEIGYNYRMSNIIAGIGRGQMQVLDRNVNLRRNNHDFYVSLFAEIDSVTVFSVPNDDYFSNYWLTAITVEPNAELHTDSEKIRLAFEKENIESRPLWKPMHLQPIFEKYPYYGSSVAENLFKKGLCLPSGSNLTTVEKERIASVIKNLFHSK